MTKTAFIGPRLRNGRTRTNVRRVAPAVKNYVKNEIVRQGEQKLYDNSIGLTNVTTTGLVFNMFSGLPQGNANGQRLGNMVTAQKMRLKFVLRPGSTQADTEQIRFMVVQDRQIGQGIPSPTDILSTAHPNAFIQQSNALSKRFKIIIDQTYMVGYYLGDNVNSYQRTWDKEIKHFQELEWNNAGTASKGQFYGLIVADNVTGAPAQYSVNMRLFYTD